MVILRVQRQPELHEGDTVEFQDCVCRFCGHAVVVAVYIFSEGGVQASLPNCCARAEENARRFLEDGILD